MPHKKLTILIAAGGTGGHLFPAQQLAEQLSDCEIAFAGHKLQETPFFTKGKVPFWEISSAPPKKDNWLRFLVSIGRGFCQSLLMIRKFKPDVVVGFGSYHSFPILLAAAITRKKIVLFEANCALGKVNRIFSKIARCVAIQFPLERPLRNAILVPYLPWKAPEEKISKEAARAYFGLSNRFTFLIFGGSQGATFLNETLPKALPLLQGIDFQVIHLTGKGSPPISYGTIPASVKEFEKEMDFAYAAADLAICRSGAGTVAELIRHQVPSLLIPFPQAADNHQWKNGQFLENGVKGAKIVAQKEASPEKIVQELESLIQQIDEKKMDLKAWTPQMQGRRDLGALVRAIGETT